MGNEIRRDAIVSGETTGKAQIPDVRLTATRDISHAGIWILMPAGQQFTLSETCRRIIGGAQENAACSLDHYLSLIRPPERKRFVAALEQAWQGRPLDLVHSIMRSDGKRCEVHVTGECLRDDRTGQAMLCGLMEDVTGVASRIGVNDNNNDRSDSGNASLSESQRLLMTANKLARIGGWQIELPPNDCVLSEEAAAIYGAEPGRPIPVRKILDQMHSRDRHAIIDAFNACLRNDTTFDLDLRFITASGGDAWIRVIGQALRDADGVAVRVHGAVQDITAKMQREEALRRHSEWLRAALESITDALFALDAEWRFTYLNREAERLLKKPRGELLGRVIWDEFDHVAEIFDREIRRAAVERHPVSFEVHYEPFGMWADVRAYPYAEGLVVYFTDCSERKRIEETMRENEERFRIVAKATTDAVWDWDLKTNSVWWNEGIHNLFGLPLREIDHAIELWAARIHPEDRDRVLRSIHEARNNGKESWSGEYRFLRKDGSYAHVFDHGFFLRDPADGTARRMIGSMTDITERKKAELERQRAEARIRDQAALLDKAQDAIVVSSVDGRISFWNKGAERLFGWTEAEVLGKNETEFLVTDHDAFNKALNAVLVNDEWRGELDKCHKSGKMLTVEAHWTLVKGETGKPMSIFAIDTDITQRKAAEREIQYLAFYDPLTKLPNRRLLLDRLQHAMTTARRSHHVGALLFIDLDNFKSLNDTLGHDKGDILLQQVAQRIERSVRESNTVARLGGDEFVIVLEDLSEDISVAATQAEIVAEKILASFHRPFELPGYIHHSTPSIGIALFDHESLAIDELLKRADLAMYQAKAAGRNTIRFFDPHMQSMIAARVALESDLRHGLQQHQFVLHYQSQNDASGHIKGVEALVRWQHPQRGLVSPSLFIPLAEETGLILRLGQWVLEAACRQLAAWAEQPVSASLTLAVNISAHQFRHRDFVQQVMRVLDETGANPRNLKLELTESLLVQNIEDTIGKMAALKARGVGFSLDDFGTGYSSLYYLKRLPLDQLKIDQSFVRDVLTDNNDAAIARTIVALAQTLGLEAIAEGVETVEQRDFLARHGCHTYQGYLFSRPVPAEQVNYDGHLS